MRSHKKSAFFVAAAVILTVVVLAFGTWEMTAKAQAAPDRILVTFTDPAPVQYTDLGGNLLGEGVLVGELQCVGEVCNQKIEFQPATETSVYEYKFKSLGAFDPAAERLVVSGTGTIASSGSKSKFSFSAVFEANGDGTMQVTYSASIPQASFAFPAVPGTFEIR